MHLELEELVVAPVLRPLVNARAVFLRAPADVEDLARVFDAQQAPPVARGLELEELVVAPVLRPLVNARAVFTVSPADVEDLARAFDAQQAPPVARGLELEELVVASVHRPLVNARAVFTVSSADVEDLARVFDAQQAPLPVFHGPVKPAFRPNYRYYTALGSDGDGQAFSRFFVFLFFL
jgi:hypothetical protein